ncbi:cytochrome c [Pigmentiphaga soli]|uniref:Cytochrome c n=1 Tax=Pigmentiphaga soli TaxID=1007095 RepID=A0ABP8HBE8_9BURK
MDAAKTTARYAGIALGCMLSCTAHAGYDGLGRAPTAAEIAGWNIDVDPSGTALPKGGGTVAGGQKIYQTMCVSCHGMKLEGGLGPALVGGQGTLASDKPVKTVGSYWPYATTLFDYIRRAMPFQAPQSLTNEQVYSVTGYVLHMNGLLPADAEVNAKTLMSVKMPNRNGFYLDDRPDARNVRCMEHCLSASKR